MSNGKGSKRRPETIPGNYSRNYDDIDWGTKRKKLPGINFTEEFLPRDVPVTSRKQVHSDTSGNTIKDTPLVWGPMGKKIWKGKRNHPSRESETPENTPPSSGEYRPRPKGEEIFSPPREG